MFDGWLWRPKKGCCSKDDLAVTRKPNKKACSCCTWKGLFILITILMLIEYLTLGVFAVLKVFRGGFIGWAIPIGIVIMMSCAVVTILNDRQNDPRLKPIYMQIYLIATFLINGLAILYYAIVTIGYWSKLRDDQTTTTPDPLITFTDGTEILSVDNSFEAEQRLHLQQAFHMSLLTLIFVTLFTIFSWIIAVFYYRFIRDSKLNDEYLKRPQRSSMPLVQHVQI